MQNHVSFPSLSRKLLSVQAFTSDNDCCLVFSKNSVSIMNPTYKPDKSKIAEQHPTHNGLYEIPVCSVTPISPPPHSTHSITALSTHRDNTGANPNLNPTFQMPSLYPNESMPPPTHPHPATPEPLPPTSTVPSPATTNPSLPSSPHHPLSPIPTPQIPPLPPVPTSSPPTPQETNLHTQPPTACPPPTTSDTSRSTTSPLTSDRRTPLPNIQPSLPSAPQPPPNLTHQPAPPPTAPKPARVRGAKTDNRTQYVPYPVHLPDIPASQWQMLNAAYNWHLIMNHVNIGTITDMAKYFEESNLPALLRHLPSSIPMHCSGCSIGHFQRAPHHGTTPHPPPGHTIATDIAGPIGNGKGTPGKFQHFITVTELNTNMHIVFLMKRRSEADSKLRQAVAMIERHFGRQISRVRCDNAAEYLSIDMRTWFAERGTHLDPTIPHSPQQNSVAERLNRTLMDRVRATLAAVGLDFNKYWALCLLDTVTKTNAVLHSPSNTVPLIEWNRHRQDTSPAPLRSSDLTQFRMFGETAYIPVRDDIKSKSAPRARLVRYLYTDASGRFQTIDVNTGLFQMVRPQDYRPYNPNFDPRRLYEQPMREHVKPRVNQHYALPHMACCANAAPVAFNPSLRDVAHEPMTQDPVTQDPVPQDPVTQDPVAPDPVTQFPATHGVAPAEDRVGDTSPLSPPCASPTSQQRETAVSQTHESSAESDMSSNPCALSAYMDAMTDIDPALPAAPASIQEARDHPDADGWRAALDKEMRMHEHFGTFKYVAEKTVKKRSLVPKAVVRFTYKLDDKGRVSAHKARVAYPGHRLHAGVHYDPRALATYAADRDTIRLLLAIAVTHKLQINHIDLPSAFVQEKYPDGTEPVLLQPIPNWDGTPSHPGKIAVLIRNLYGTPDASRIYSDGLQAHLIDNGWAQSQADPCLYTKMTSNGLLVLAITIDDFLAASPTAAGYADIKAMLRRKYVIKDLGTVKKLLNWTITRTPDGCMHISQPNLIKSFIDTMGMNSAHPASTPYASGIRLHPSTNDEPLLPTSNRFAKALGILRYIVDSTRPDLAFITTALARSMARPAVRHWTALKHVARYLRATPTHGLWYTHNTRGLSSESRTTRDPKYFAASPPPQPPHLELETDADFAGCKTTRKSTRGSITRYGNCVTSWCSRTIKSIVTSSTEAEYIGLSETGRHACWERQLLSDITAQPKTTTPIFTDNDAAKKIAEARGPTKKSKYIDVRWHHVRDLVARKVVSTNHRPSKELSADCLTKSLGPQLYLRHRDAMNIVPMPPAAPVAVEAS